MNKKPSSSDVAIRAGVSTATVSYVFNGRKNASVPDATRKRVLEAAEMIGYRPNRLASSLAHGKTHLVGLVSRLDTFDARIAAPIRDELTKGGYQILLARSQEHFELEQREVQVLLEHQVDALICVTGGWGMDDARPWIPAVMEYGIPCILVNDVDTSGQLDSVVTDNYNAAKEVVRHLAERGHKRIGHVPGGDGYYNGRERKRGYLDAIQELGLDCSPELLQGGGFNAAAGYEGTRRLLALPNPPTAIFTGNDGSASGAYHAVQDLNLLCPEDVALVGFGDECEASALRITTIDQYTAQMAHIAVDRVFTRMQQPQMPVERLEVPTSLIVRRTT